MGKPRKHWSKRASGVKPLNESGSLVSQAEFARRQEVSRPRVNQWIQAGMPHIDRKIDFRAASQWLADNVDRVDAIAQDSLNEARRRSENAKAHLLENQVARENRLLLPADEIEEEWSAIISAARNRLLLMATKLAPKMAGLSDVRACQRLIELEVRECLSSLASS